MIDSTFYSTEIPRLDVDLLVIGWGKGGKTLARTMGAAGQRVVMVEQSSDMYGGTCINVGCVPTKALLHQAEQRPDMADAEQWHRQAIGTVQTLSSMMRAKNFDMLDTVDTITTLTGHAEFIEPKTVRVTGGEDLLEVTAKNIVINTGATPVIPDLPGLAESKHIATNVEMLSDQDLPSELLVIGGGYLGVEFANMFRQLGSAVTVLEANDRTFGREDEDVAEVATAILAEEGIEFITDARATSVQDTIDDRVTVTFEVAGETREITVDKVLVAVGRRPMTDGLGLETAGIETARNGAVVVDDYLRTSVDGVYAVGDVNGGPQFTYISLDDYRIVAEQLRGGGAAGETETAARNTKDRVAVPYTVFMTPPLGRVGMTEKEAREAGYDVVVKSKAVAQVAAMPRAKIMQDPRGLMKFVIDAKTDQILGAALLVVDAQEVINLVAMAMRHGITASELRNSIYTHPSTTEGLNEVLG